MTTYLRPDDDLEARRMEWANLKCRAAVYSGDWPEWTDRVLVPSWEDVHRFSAEMIGIEQYSNARRLR